MRVDDHQWEDVFGWGGDINQAWPREAQSKRAWRPQALGAAEGNELEVLAFAGACGVAAAW